MQTSTPYGRSSDHNLALYLKLNSTAPGHQQAISFLQGRYASISALNTAWYVIYESLVAVVFLTSGFAALFQRGELLAPVSDPRYPAALRYESR